MVASSIRSSSVASIHGELKNKPQKLNNRIPKENVQQSINNIGDQGIMIKALNSSIVNSGDKINSRTLKKIL